MNAVFEFSSGAHHHHDAHAFSHVFTPLDAPTHAYDANRYADFSLSNELSTSTLIRALDEALPIGGGKDMLSMHDALMEDPIVVVKNEEDDEDGDAYAGLDEEVKISEMQSTLEAAMKNVLVCLIGEYLGEAITLRQFLAKIRGCLYAPESSAANREVFTWILRCMLEGGSSSDNGSHVVHRMAGFLEENGVTKDEIEASSAAMKEDSGAGFEFDIGEKRKRREKKSISRGLRSAPNKWSKAESQMLIRLVHENGDKSWKRIAEQLGGGKTGAQCAQHWKRVLSPQIRKGSWDDQEEELLLALVERYGQSWKNIAGEIKTRTDIQCRYQYQKSCLSRQCEWQEQEDALLLKKVAQMLHEGSGSNNPTRASMNGSGSGSGNVLPVNWVEVAKFIARAKLTKIPRTALECKQRWVITRNNGTHQQQASPLVLTNNNNNNNNINTNTNNTTNNNTNNISNNHPNSPNSNNNTNNNHLSNSISSHTAPSNITNHQFHNINYSSINSNFTMVSAPYASSPAVTQTF